MELFLNEHQFIRPPCISVLVDWQTHGKNKTQGCQGTQLSFANK